MRWRGCLAAAGTALVGVLFFPAPAGAHPLGNFTTNSAAHLDVEPHATQIHYVVDLAEIPALQAITSMDADGDGQPGTSEANAYRHHTCGELRHGLGLRLDGRPLEVTVGSSAIAFPEGQAGLLTLRLECNFSAQYPALTAPARLTFTDGNHEGRIGWREITARGSLTQSDVPERSTTDSLRSYPKDVGGAPPAQRSATMVVGPRGVGMAASDLAAFDLSPAVRGADRLTASLTSLVAERELTAPFALGAVTIALMLGALHALAPGHGKTVMAAYLVGQRGDHRQALQLGVTVAVTHTFGVLILGVALSASETLAPERMFPWLGVVSGLLFAAVGIVLLHSALIHRHGHGHSHDHPHHGHHPAAHAPPSWRSLIAPGLAGGLVPSPSALVVLLGGIALGRAWFGLSLVLCYGLGMALTLVGAGVLLQRVRTRLEGSTRSGRRPRLARAAAALPLATAAMIIVGGLLIAVRSGVTA